MNYHTTVSDDDEWIWQQIVAHAGEEFHTARGLPFTYSIKRSRDGSMLGEMVGDRKQKTITRNTVLLAYERSRRLMESDGYVSGPKKLGVFGASYLYSIFIELNICQKIMNGGEK